MAKMSYEQLKQYVKNVVTAGKISVADFDVTRNNTVKLLDKIGKIVVLDTDYATDKLALFDGEYLSFGKTIEEWSADLIAVEDYDASGSGALSPHRSTFRPVFYSYTLGRKKIPQTIDYNDVERAVHNEGQFVDIISMKYKRIEDSMAQYRYAVKREMIARLYEICSSSDLKLGNSAEAKTWNAVASSTWASVINAKGTNGFCVLTASSTAVGYAGKYIAVKDIPADSTKKLSDLVAEGYLIKLDLVTEIAKPVDDTTGEAFIKQLKKDVEIARDSSEGHSLNGNALGATEGLVLIVKQGILPSLETDTWAGAFNKDEVALPAEVISVKDFGSEDDDVYALLVDRRGLRLHNTYNATRENLNGDGDFLNLFRHTEDTAYISRNVFVKFYKEPQA